MLSSVINKMGKSTRGRATALVLTTSFIALLAVAALVAFGTFDGASADDDGKSQIPSPTLAAEVGAGDDLIVVMVRNRLCEGGTELFSADKATLDQACARPIERATFSLQIDYAADADSDPNETLRIGTHSDGLGIFEGPKVRAGSINLMEVEKPFDYGALTVYCAAFSGPFDPTALSFQSMPLVGGQIVDGLASGEVMSEVAAGQNLYCDWYNILPKGAVAGEASITIAKTECPSGYDAAGATLDDLLLDCQTPGIDVVFDLSDGDFIIQEELSDLGGIAFFDGEGPGGLAPDTYLVSEQVPPGYAEPVVYCETSSPNNPDGDGPILMAVEKHDDILATLIKDNEEAPANEISLPLQGNEEAHCNWFNVPE